MSPAPTNLVLDAMGVLYQCDDDVTELLVPFVRKRNPSVSTLEIEQVYLEASLGHIDNNKFWQKFNLDPNIEDNYLSAHLLMDDVTDFLSDACDKFEMIGCLSNDVAAWSLKLRNKFSLTNWITHWVISGDVGYRKPFIEIYSILLSKIATEPSNVLFVDDRPKNLDAARSLGFNTVLFDPSGVNKNTTHQAITRLSELLN